MKKILRNALLIGLSFGLLAFALRSVPFSALIAQIRQASAGWVLVTALLISIQVFMRGWRWQLLIRGLGYGPSIWRALVAMLSGSIAGLVVPGSGEILRCTLLQRTDRVPIVEAAGTVITERLVDLLATLLFMVLTLLLESDQFFAYFREHVGMWPRPSVGLIATAVGLLLACGMAFWWLLHKGILMRLPQWTWFKERLQSFRRGLLSVRQVESQARFWTLTLGIHTLSLFIFAALFQALPVAHSLPVSASLTVLTLASLGGLAIPTQASIGTYHFLASRGLQVYGLPLSSGIIWATFSHAVITLVNLAFSALGFLAALRFLKDKTQSDTDPTFREDAQSYTETR